jgi:ribosome maturation protein SDO1
LVVSIDKAVTARLMVGNMKFEILVDPELALEFKQGKLIKLEEALAYPAVYKDARSSEVASEKDMQKLFGTTDVYKIAEKIIKQGEIQLTTEQKRRMVEQKKVQVANLIAKKAINPQTNTPHPPQRILNAIEQVGISIDPFVDAELQVDKVLKGIKHLLPIKFQKILAQIKVPSQFAGKAYAVIKGSGTLKQEQWLGDGSLQVSVEMFAGVQEDLMKKLADITHGQADFKILQREDV